MRFKPWWLGLLILGDLGLIAIKNVYGWDGDLSALIGVIFLAIGYGLRDLFGVPPAEAA